MIRSLLALALISIAAPLRAETCAPIERVDGPPVYAILHGYPDSPLEPDPLSMVDRDLVNMWRFFGSLGPRRAFVHSVASARLQAGGIAHQPATWRALRASVDEVLADIDGDERPHVYLYFAGHGHVDAADRLQIFTTPEDEPSGPGFDGVIDSKLIAEHIIAPLAARAEVHVIVDTCHGAHMVQTRSARRTPPRTATHALDFAGRFPTVGAQLAARGKTAEIRPYGGIFSHLVRSLAIGIADHDRDGIITYGEMADAMPQSLPELKDGPAPEVIAPDGRWDRPFIDWRTSRAARVCFEGDVEGRFVVYDKPELYATVHLPDEPRAYWLPTGRTLGLERWRGRGRYFVAEDGPVVYLDVSPFSIAATEPETTADAPPAWEPLPTLLAAAPMPGRWLSPSPFSVGVAALGGLSLFGVGYRDRPEYWAHGDLALRLGYHRHRLLAEFAYAHASAFATTADPHDGPAPFTGHRLGGRAGYGYLVSSGAYDVSAGVLIGRHRLWGKGGLSGAKQFEIQDFAVRAAITSPVFAYTRWRVDAELGVALSGVPIGPTLRLNAGVDFDSLAGL